MRAAPFVVSSQLLPLRTMVPIQEVARRIRTWDESDVRHHSVARAWRTLHAVYGAGRPALMVLTGVAALLLIGCDTSNETKRENLARTHCAACHAFPEPELLDKESWRSGVLPQMAPRLGVTASVFARLEKPHMNVLTRAISSEDWNLIVAYYLERAPEKLPDQTLPTVPLVDPALFKVGPFVPRLESSAIITLLKSDPVAERIFVGEAGSNRLRIFDWNRRLIATAKLASPPTDVIFAPDHFLLLESGILNPNDQPAGRLVRYDLPSADTPRFSRVLIDSLLRPVFVQQIDFDNDGLDDFLICEYGDNRGQLALYRGHGAGYAREVLDSSPGAIRFEIRDMTGDGHADIVALFAQGDERIALFENDGKGVFSSRQRILARFSPLNGSMHFSLHDFNGDGRLDILYVNGDNFDFSRVLKPYHGIRILENDGKNRFIERFFFPVYGAARAEAVDLDKDGDLDILTTSNFADFRRNPERGITFLENAGGHSFQPFAFTAASHNQWNLMATADLNKDGWTDVIVGAMNLDNIAKIQQRFGVDTLRTAGDPIVVFENRMQASPSPRR